MTNKEIVQDASLKTPHFWILQGSCSL